MRGKAPHRRVISYYRLAVNFPLMLRGCVRWLLIACYSIQDVLCKVCTELNELRLPRVKITRPADARKCVHAW